MNTKASAVTLAVLIFAREKIAFGAELMLNGGFETPITTVDIFVPASPTTEVKVGHIDFVTEGGRRALHAPADRRLRRKAVQGPRAFTIARREHG